MKGTETAGEQQSNSDGADPGKFALWFVFPKFQITSWGCSKKNSVDYVCAGASCLDATPRPSCSVFPVTWNHEFTSKWKTGMKCPAMAPPGGKEDKHWRTLFEWAPPQQSFAELSIPEINSFCLSVCIYLGKESCSQTLLNSEMGSRWSCVSGYSACANTFMSWSCTIHGVLDGWMGCRNKPLQAWANHKHFWFELFFPLYEQNWKQKARFLFFFHSFVQSLRCNKGKEVKK